MASSGSTIQATILFSTVLGVLFLWQVYDLLPSFVFDFVASGWVLFLVDSALTFVRPKASYALGFVLALLALASSLPQSAHYAFIQAGELLPSITFIVGTAAQVLLIVLVPIHFIRARKESGSGLVQGK